MLVAHVDEFYEFNLFGNIDVVLALPVCEREGVVAYGLFVWDRSAMVGSEVGCLRAGIYGYWSFRSVLRSRSRRISPVCSRCHCGDIMMLLRMKVLREGGSRTVTLLICTCRADY